VLVQDRVKGEPLAKQVASGPLPTLRATEIAIELAKALVAAHARGLFHGDLRPQKVLIDGQGGVHLADFGMAHAACLASGFGQSGLPFGHPEYLAPEVVQERQPRPTAASDIYALGILLYELCCGSVPHRGPSHRDTLRRHLEAPLPPPPESVHVSTALAEVILRLTAKDPKRRPGEMKAALHGLEEYKKARLSGHTSDHEGVEKPEEPAKPISADDWGRQSADANEISGEWTAERIEKAEPVGPEGFDLGEEESYEPGTMPAALAYDDADEPPKSAAPAPSRWTTVVVAALVVLLLIGAVLAYVYAR
jgi:serine/threonine protein kinase